MIVVNAPVPGVVLPIAIDCNPFVVIVVNVPAAGVILPITPWKLLAANAPKVAVPCVVNEPVIVADDNVALPNLTLA